MTSDHLALIASDPAEMHGAVVIAGTRVPVSVMLDCLATGMTEAEIVAASPTVKIEGVRAAAAYGAVLAREEIVHLSSHR